MATIRIFAVVIFASLAIGAPQPAAKDEIEIIDCGQLKMKAKSTTNSLTCKIIGIIPPGIELPFNGCHSNACENMSNGDCPIEVEEMLTYDMEIKISNLAHCDQILPSYPTIEIKGRWMLKDDADENFVCIEVPMKIVP